MKMKKSYYPSYYRAADKASITAQNTYLAFIIADLSSMLIGAGLTIYNYQDENAKLIIYIISGLLLLSATILSIVLKIIKYEDIWYQGRAVAESCKTITWRYMMCSELFESELSSQQSKSNLGIRLKEIANQFPDLNKHTDAKLLSLQIITKKMENVRSWETQRRKQFYIQERIEDQKNWYSRESKKNKKRYQFWFWLVIISQIFALISVAYLIKFPTSDWNVTSLITTISACAFSWLQLKNYQELKQAYTTTAVELNHIFLDVENIKTDSELSKFVLDSENAISREHTMWLAQKRIL